MPGEGTTQGAADDYRSPASAACYSGVGQAPTAAPGRDVVYTFTASGAAQGYSFRVTGYDPAQNPVLYVASSCPGGPPPQTPACIAGANRTLRAEDVSCLPLAAGEQVYIFVDDAGSGNAGGAFTLEVTRCISAETEPNDAPLDAGVPACWAEGSIGTSSDQDFYALSPPAPGARAFALVDGVAANANGFDLRVTTFSDTLEFDDADNDVPFGSSSPNCEGTPLTSDTSFLRITNHTAATSEPYRLAFVLQPPLGSAAAESEPNGTLASASTAGGGYFLGALAGPAPSTDIDAFAFCAEKGDLVFLGLDGDPLRNRTPVNGQLALLDGSGTALVSVNDARSTSSIQSGAGSLAATTPNSPGEGLTWRARYSGAYYAVVSIGTASGAQPGAGDYLLSIATNCLNSGQRLALLSLTESDSADPVVAGQVLSYTLMVTNDGPHSALNAQLSASTPAHTTFVSLAAPAGWTCTTPAAGGTGPIACSALCLVPGPAQAFSLAVRVNACSGDGTILTSAAAVSSLTEDPLAGNNAASEPTTIVDPGICSDGNACTAGDSCAGGACVSGSPVDCEDCSPCTLEACDPAMGCVYTNVPGPCDDGNPCTTADACTAGVCQGSAVSCDDANPCSDDACDPAAGGACVHTNNTAACSDGNACTGRDHCSAGACVSTPLDCNDNDPCTTDACSPASGCTHAPGAGPCNDGSACTSGDHCAGGICTGTTLNCSDGNPCTDDTCKPATGCLHTNNTASCNDGNACTHEDVCAAGVCVGGPADLSVTKTDSADPILAGQVLTYTITVTNAGPDSAVNAMLNEATPASTTFVSLASPVGWMCSTPAPGATGAILCSTGCLAPGAPAVFTLAVRVNFCVGDGALLTNTASVSSAATDPKSADNAATQTTLVVDPGSCDDGDCCTAGDVCVAGICVAGSPLDCSDCNPCTDDACSPSLGCVYTNNMAACDDGNACTTGDSCADGSCAGVPALCDDGNACTDDTCDAVGGCVFTPDDGNTCSDGNACTLGDFCSSGHCLAGPPVVCDDGNPCTDDACDPMGSCVFTSNDSNTCSDGNACTLGDLCSSGLCQAGPPAACDDGNACTDDACDPTTGCVHTPGAAPADLSVTETDSADPILAGQVLTYTLTLTNAGPGAAASAVLSEATPAGTTFVSLTPPPGWICSSPPSGGTGPITCTAACLAPGPPAVFTLAVRVNQCIGDGALLTSAATVSSATADPNSGNDAATQPTLVVDPGTCEDGDCCTTDDVCMAGICVAGPAVSCDDCNACTDDACNPLTGCVFTNNDANPCSDGDACTTGDACSAGTCAGGPPANCDDGNPCTTDVCDAAMPGGCLYTPVNCDDQNLCTVDSCSPMSGCVNDAPAANGAPCGSPSDTSCDDPDTCLGGACQTNHAPSGTPCDDGNACTTSDACAGGLCAGTDNGATIITNLKVGAPCGISGCTDKHALRWDPVSGGAPYDIIFGNLQVLHSSGLTGSVGGCLGDNLSTPMFDDTDSPGPGQGFYYLARSRSTCSGLAGTYNEGGNQAAPRDPLIPPSIDCSRP